MERRTLPAEKKAAAIAALLIAVYVSPLFLLGEDAHIRVHDNLDSNIAWYRVLVRSGEWFGAIDARIGQVMNGIPRNAYGTEFSGIVALHAFLPPMTAYAVSQTVTRAFAFIGMYLLLGAHFVRDPDAWPIRVFVALAFALTPFWPSGMLSTLGHPLALWAFLNIRARRASWKEWLTLTLLPLYSSFILGFFFFLFAMGLLWLRDALMRRDPNPVLLAAIAYMTALYLAVDFRLVHSLVLSDEPTSRNEFVSSRLSTWRCVRLTFKNFVLGHHHVATVHTFVILPLTFIVLLWTLARPVRNGTERTFLTLTGINFLLSAWYAFWFHKAWQPLKEAVALFNTFNFARFHFLRPLVIYLGFALGALILWRTGRRGRRFAAACLAAQIAVLFLFNEEIVHRKLHAPSFREFYAEEQFAAIREAIGLPQDEYRVASIGLHPAVAQFNGFYTLDSYNNFYPLSYKRAFRPIIAAELAKNGKLRKYFDTWGGRCYIFVDELGKKYDYRKNSKKRIRNLELDTDAFRRLGGRYFFSAVPIDNAAENGLRLLGVFDHEDSAWRIYVYEVI